METARQVSVVMIAMILRNCLHVSRSSRLPMCIVSHRFHHRNRAQIGQLQTVRQIIFRNRLKIMTMHDVDKEWSPERKLWWFYAFCGLYARAMTQNWNSWFNLLIEPSRIVPTKIFPQFFILAVVGGEGALRFSMTMWRLRSDRTMLPHCSPTLN